MIRRTPTVVYPPYASCVGVVDDVDDDGDLDEFLILVRDLPYQELRKISAKENFAMGLCRCGMEREIRNGKRFYACKKCNRSQDRSRDRKKNRDRIIEIAWSSFMGTCTTEN